MDDELSELLSSSKDDDDFFDDDDDNGISDEEALADVLSLAEEVEVPESIDELYQLAADMGGAGYIF